MSDLEKQFLKKLLETFKLEAKEHIAVIAAKLGELERADASMRMPIVEVAFREAHSLKAAARAVSQKEMELVCQGMESVFAALKRGELAVSSVLVEVLFRANDALGELLAASEAGVAAPDRMRAEQLLRSLQALQEGETPKAVEDTREKDTGTAQASVPASAETVRLPVERLDALMRQAEDMLSVKLAAQAQATALRDAVTGFAQWKDESHRARSAIEELRNLPAAKPLLGFLESNARHVAQFEAMLTEMGNAAANGSRGAGLRIDRLLQDFKQLLMMKSGTLLEVFPKVVRDLARDQAKDVELIVEGTELEIDRRILEEMKEPLLHLVRNCIDHGVEKPDERKAKGKPARATVRLTVTPKDSDKVEFVISDDGAGIPLKRLAAAAIKAGLLSAERAAVATEADLIPLVFHSGISTSPMITDISGRGLGLAIVREKLERLGGNIQVQSSEGRGTSFVLVVPLTLATFRGISVSVGERLFVIPATGVECVVRRGTASLRTIENRAALEIDGSHVPLVRLGDVLELAPSAARVADKVRVVAVVLGSAARRVAFEVDEVLGNQEVLVKPLGKCLERVRNVSAVTLLADGRIAPILNVHDLLKSARNVASVPAAPALEAQRAGTRPMRVLVVEDSITARSLLKNILEAAGYRVKVTVDGVDAWAALKLEQFDIVVSDVEMPRMNGFDLTARIRADNRLGELPVVLITALGSAEDRERGVQVGANAYILKSDFDQRRLLEVLRRMV